MKIMCNQEEKEQLLIVLATGNQCPFAKSHEIECDREMECKECIEKNIGWAVSV